MESAAVRRKTMQAVKNKDTAPELLVRRLLHANGYRYRLHQCNLPGCPDLVFSSRKKVVFINGCFWHGHDCVRGSRVPKTNRKYWMAKIGRNRARDANATQQLATDGWKTLVLWECELQDERQLLRRLRTFLK